MEGKEEGRKGGRKEGFKVMSRCLSALDATTLHHCLKNKQQKQIWLKW